jgi:hypothetical protein
MWNIEVQEFAVEQQGAAMIVAGAGVGTFLREN